MTTIPFQNFQNRIIFTNEKYATACHLLFAVSSDCRQIGLGINDLCVYRKECATASGGKYSHGKNY